MNQVHRVVFNAVTGVWQAVSEIAKGRVKSSRSSAALSGVAGALLIGAFTSTPAWAVADPALRWDGSQIILNGVVDGGSGTWDADGTNWTNAGGTFNTKWYGGVAVFQGTAGTVTVNGAQQFSGMQFITNGYNVVNGASGQLTAVNGSGGTTEMRVDLGATATVGVNIDGSGTLNKLGAGTLVLNGTNSHSGGTQLSDGTLVVGSNTALGTGNLFVTGASKLSTNGNLTLANNTVLSADLTVQGTDDLTLSGEVSGAGRLIKNSSGSLTLSGNNANYSGLTNLNQGTLILGSSNALGSGGLNVFVGTLKANASVSLANQVSLFGTLTVSGNDNLTFNGALTGGGGLSKSGTADLTLNGANFYLGGTTLSGGRLVVGNNSSLGLGALAVAGASTLSSSGNVTLANNVTLNAGLTVDGANDLTLNGVINGNFGLTKSGSGNLTINGNNFYQGGIQLNAGRLTVGNFGALGTGTLAVTADATLANSSPMSLANTIALSNSANLTVDAANQLILSGDISGNGNLIKTGVDTLTLVGVKTFTGNVDIQAGSITTLGSDVLANVGTLNVGSSGRLNLYGNASLGSLTGSGQVDGIGSVLSLGSNNLSSTFAGGLNGLGGLTKVGSGTLTLTGTSNLVDTTSVNAGTLKVDGTLGSNLLTVASGATLTGSGNANATVVIGNGGQLAGQSGSTLGLGNLVLNSGSIVNAGLGAPSTGGTALFSVGGNLILDGTLNVSNIGGFGNGVYRIFNYSGALADNGLDFGSLPAGVALGDVSLQTALANQVNLLVSSAGLGLQFWNGSQSFPTGQIEGGAGVWNASNSNWSDANGMLSAMWGNNFAVFQGTGGDVTVEGSHTVNGMQFVTNGYRLLAGTGGELNLVNDTGGNTNLRVDPGATAILDVGLTGSGKLNKLDTGTLVLNGSNTYTGGTILSGGTLVAGNNNALGSGTLETAAGVTLDSNTAVKLSNAINLGGPLNIAGSNNLELAGVINGAGGLVKNGSAALTLSGSNGYNGTTTINAGTLQVGNGGTSGNLGTGAVTNNGSLVFNRSDATTVSNNISGTGSLVHVGTGITTLTGSNSYTGGTFVQAGTLKIGTLSSLVQGTLYQVSSGATLDLNGYALKTGGISGTGHVALGSQSLTVNTAAGAVSEFDGKMDGTGELIKQGDGTLSLNTANSFSGGVSHKGGNINLGNEKGLGSGTLSMDDDTKITLIANGMTIANNLHMTGDKDPIVDTGANNGTWTGAITGAGFLTKQGIGTLTMTSTGNTYTGATDVAQGTLQAGAVNTFSSTSAHTVASGAVLDLAGYNQTLASLNNSGTVKLSSNSGATPGTVLKVTGAYVGNNGNLGLSTVLGADGSATDKLLLSGASAVASGNTTVHITNAGGLGAQTTGNGIGIIGTENGASLQPGSFTLAGGHVDAGAYEYRLTQNAQGAALHSTTTAPTTPTTPTTAYRAEVPLLSALPAQLRQADMAMLGDLRKRMGDEGAQATTSSDTGASRRVWGRILRTDPKISQQGTVSPESSGHLTGFQAGLDLYADQSIKAGIYVGQLEGDMSVKGFASGVDRKYVGFNNLRTRYLGVYGTWQDQSGLYADAVLQGADYRSDLRTAGDTAQARTKGSGWLASLEMGKAFELSSHWKIEPQAQIIYRKLSIDDTALSLATVKNKADDDWTVRLGARIKGNFATGAGVLQPYGRINVFKASNTTDIASFAAPGGTTDIKAKGGYTATEMAAGASLQINPRTSVYGELGKLWANGGDSRVKSGVQASIGVKVQW